MERKEMEGGAGYRPLKLVPTDLLPSARLFLLTILSSLPNSSTSWKPSVQIQPIYGESNHYGHGV